MRPVETLNNYDVTWVAAFERLFGSNPLQCPACKTGVLVVTRVLQPKRA